MEGCGDQDRKFITTDTTDHNEHNGSEHQTAKAVLQANRIEIDQIAEPQRGKTEVGQNLSDMDRREGVDRFDLNHDAVLDEQVEAVANIQSSFAITDWNANLSVNPESGSPQIFGETRFIGALEQARTERAMHVESGVHDRSPDFIDPCG